MTIASKTSGQVYVIGSPGSRIVKIGYSNAPEKRLWFLQVGSPVELSLLARFEGSQDLEAALHRYFGARHVRGEWFDLGANPVEAVRAAVALGVAGLCSAAGTTAIPGTTRSNRSSTALDMPGHRAMEGIDLGMRFPPLPRWRAEAVLAVHDISGVTNEWVNHVCEGCPDCLAHFPPRFALRPHLA
ncbi:GIY-YIG nuclease family protein [Streptomyces swartbergensis]|uniref:GIY-YIG nuclease family protein n=1 Tax=Streptomyces swartbergensis TaxID=487165 RepID=UPI0038134C61